MGKKKVKKEKELPMVFVACVNNSGFRSEYATNGMFGMGWFLGANGIKAASYTFDSHPISVARNEACEVFLKNKAFTHIFFIDSDSVPKADIIIRLLQHDKPIVSGWYLSRAGSGLPVVLKIITKNTPKCLSCIIKKPKLFPEYKAYKLQELLTLPKEKTTGLIKVDAVGAGALLISREALSHLEKPFFYEDHIHPHGFGEDTFFGLNCKFNKVPIYIDLNAFVSHFTWGLIDMRHVKALIERSKRQSQIKRTFNQKKPPM